jgi:hypothetical protein
METHRLESSSRVLVRVRMSESRKVQSPREGEGGALARWPKSRTCSSRVPVPRFGWVFIAGEEMQVGLRSGFWRLTAYVNSMSYN